MHPLNNFIFGGTVIDDGEHCSWKASPKIARLTGLIIMGIIYNIIYNITGNISVSALRVKACVDVMGHVI